MPKKSKFEKSVSFGCDSKLRFLIEQAADTECQTMSGFVRRIVRDYLKAQQEESKPD